MRKSAQIQKAVKKSARGSLAVVFADDSVAEKVRKVKAKAEERSVHIGRPFKELDEAEIYKMAKEGATLEEMSVTLDASPTLLHKRYDAVIKRGQAYLNKSLRRKQVDLALKGDRTMLIWLGKNLLGQRDSLDMSNKDGTLAGAWAAALGAVDKKAKAEA